MEMKTSPRSSLPISIARFLAAALFALFAFLQINDIDPAVYENASRLDSLLWFGFYLLIAAMFVFSVFRPLPLWLLIVSVLACLIEMATTAPGLIENLFGKEDFVMTQTSMSAEDPRVELTREFFGALIALAGVAALWIGNGRRKSAQEG